MTKLYAFLSSLPVQILCRIVLGGIFIFASIDKVLHTHQFASIIHNFRLLPPQLVYFVALVLPWFELICGLFVLSGIYTRTGAVLLTGLLSVFIIAMLLNLARGLDTACGCFSTSSQGGVTIFTVLRDSLILIPALILIFFPRRAGE